jgi:hypothetical protein
MDLHIELAAPADLNAFLAEDAPPLGLAEDAPRLLREAHLLHPGVFNGHDFTAAELRAFATSFRPEDPPPLQLDHSQKARDTVGYLRAVRLVHDDSGPKLRGLVEFLGAEAVTAVREGRWRKLSLGLRLRPRPEIRELSVTPFPAVSDPEPARVLAEGGIMDEETTQEAPVGTPEPAQDEPEKPDNETPEDAQDEPTEADEAEEKGLSEGGERTLNLTNDERAELLALREEREMRLVADQVEGLLASGRSVPALREKESAFLRSLTPDQREDYLALRKASPPIVTLGRLSRPDTNPPGTTNQAQVEQEAREMLELSRLHRPVNNEK